MHINLKTKKTHYKTSYAYIFKIVLYSRKVNKGKFHILDQSFN